MKWHLKAATVRERVPLLLADAETWRQWKGPHEPKESYDALDGEVGVIDAGGRKVVPSRYLGGIFDVGLGKDELVLLQHFPGDVHDELDDLREELGVRSFDEYAAGELEITSGVVICDPWQQGSELPATLPSKAGPLDEMGFFVPLRAGTYLVLEGRSEEATWYRLRKGRASEYAKR